MYCTKLKQVTAFGESIQLQDRIRATTCVAKVVHHLRCSLRISGQIYEELFITTLIYPFKHGHSYSPMTMKPFALSNLEYLCKLFNVKGKEFLKMKQKPLVKIQA